MLKLGNLTKDSLCAYYRKPQPIHLSASVIDWVDSAHQTVLDLVNSGQPIYGINTGFGRLAYQMIDEVNLNQLQHNLILSHACGVGDYFSPNTVNLILLLKINSLAQGYSGISVATLQALLALYNHQLWPCIPCQGSVGASGDLSPLAHLALPLLGKGEVWYQGHHITATQALKQCGLTPITLQPKEGLALINGTQVSTALAVEGWLWTDTLWQIALQAGALTMEAMRAHRMPLDRRLHALKPHPGQQLVAKRLSDLLAGSQMDPPTRIQDPYSLRCQPQVMGACWDQWQYAGEVLLREANSVSDNPLILSEEDLSLSGGNFHAESVGMVADALAVVLSEIGALSERRIALMMDPSMSGLPAFLTPTPGLHSGLMILQYTAAALASENKSLCFPTCVDSIPTSNNQEDHVSMATHGARRLQQMARNTAHILAIEMICAAQAIDLRQAKDKIAPALQKTYQWIRTSVGFTAQDASLSAEIQSMAQEMIEGRLELSQA